MRRTKASSVSTNYLVRMQDYLNSVYKRYAYFPTTLCITQHIEGLRDKFAPAIWTAKNTERTGLLPRTGYCHHHHISQEVNTQLSSLRGSCELVGSQELGRWDFLSKYSDIALGAGQVSSFLKFLPTDALVLPTNAPSYLYMHRSFWQGPAEFAAAGISTSSLFTILPLSGRTTICTPRS